MPLLGEGLPERRDLELIRRTEPDGLPWPTGKSHVAIGAPGCALEEKTFCDEAGWFSPGWGTFGVCLLVSEGKKVFRPAPFTGRTLDPRPALGHRRRERRKLRLWADSAKRVGWFLGGNSDVVWAYDIPGAMCEFRLSPMAEAPPSSESWLVARVAVRNFARRPRTVHVHILWAPVGPSGGPIREWALGGKHTVSVNGGLAAVLDRAPGIVSTASYSESGRWAYPPAAKGAPRRQVSDPAGLASALLTFEFKLTAEEPAAHMEILFAAPPQQRQRPTALKPADPKVKARREETWSLLDSGPRIGFPWSADLLGWWDAPDERVPRVFQASMAHLLNASVDGEARIAAASYPNPWLRDGAIVTNAFQKAGYRDFARRSVESFLKQPWAGDAGPEADAPGQLLWLLHQEWIYCRDRAFVQTVWPEIRRLTETIRSMRRLTAPLLVDGHPVAWPSDNGLIRGRMDSHFPSTYVNSWALCGLAAAVSMARALGRNEAREWHAEWIDLERCFLASTLPATIGDGLSNPRDLCSMVWPCRAVLASPVVRNAALRYFETRKWKDDRFVPDPNWRYFDLAQAHSYLWLDLIDPVWATLEWYFDNQEAPAAWAEIGGADVSGLWKNAWSFHDPKFVIPHGWVSAEMWHLLRDLLYFADGLQLIFGRGVPSEWWRHVSGWGVSGAMTAFGMARARLAPLRENRYAWEFHLEGDEVMAPEIVLELPAGSREIKPSLGMHLGRTFWGRPCLTVDRSGSYEFQAVIGE